MVELLERVFTVRHAIGGLEANFKGEVDQPLVLDESMDSFDFFFAMDFKAGVFEDIGEAVDVVLTLPLDIRETRRSCIGKFDFSLI